MATHKVPQDVEADDKLIGFLSLKQFIFTVLGLGFGYLTFFFFTQVHPVTSLIWILPAGVCLLLGLYQRKDQPVEVYLASALRFYLKPHKRVWSQEGYEERVVVTAPPKIERNYTKNFSGEEAYSRLSNLSRLMDSRGWATKMVSDWQNPQLATAAASDRLVQPDQLSMGYDPLTAGQPVDVMDEDSSRVAADFEQRIQQTDNTAKQRAIQTLEKARHDSAAPSESPTPTPIYKKYPDMHQKVVRPVATAPSPTAPPQATTTSAPTPEQTTPSPAPRAVTPQPQPTKSAPQKEAVETTNDDGSVEIRLH